MIKLSDDEELSENYIRYICGIESERQYKHQEILDMKYLLDNVIVTAEGADDFIYGYVVPQLNKEFDLLKITKSTCLNIELKSGDVSTEKIKRQLLQNTHYLKLLNRKILLSYLFVSSTLSLYTLDERKNLVTVPLQDLGEVINTLENSDNLNLDKVFLPRNILVSPLNSTERFLQGDYLLTEHQENIKKSVLAYVETDTQGRFAGITGGPGTGKSATRFTVKQTKR